MSNSKLPDAGKKIEPMPSIEKAKRVMEKMQNLQLKKETVNFLKGLPPMLMQNGLGQTIAFLKTKAKDNADYGKILKVFNELFNKNDLIIYIFKNSTPDDYLQMQKEAIEYAGWIKKIAIAFCQKEKKKDEPAAS
ncbi:MAG: type III-B CRISPR module-associated protein Cmr5 [bacterium]